MYYGLYCFTRVPDLWGTYDYRFNRTRELLFRPQPNWSGLDYFKAHAPNHDPALYHRVLEGQYGTKGVGLDVARRWHEQVYGSLGDVRSLSHLGHAAAYEAFQIWIHNRSEVDLGFDYGQQREAFIAIAIAEACHIFQTAQVHHERRKLQEMCETAAATAFIGFQTLSDDGHSGGSHRSPTPPSRSNPPSHDEPPDDCNVSHGSRSHSRRSSSASSLRPATTPPVNDSPNQPTSSIPIQVNNRNGESPWNPYPDSSHHYTTAIYPQQYPVGVQAVPIVGIPYVPNCGLLYSYAGPYQTQTFVQVPQYSYPVVLGPSIVIQQPARRSSRRVTSHGGKNAKNFHS